MRISMNRVMHAVFVFIFVVFLAYSYAAVYTAIGYLLYTENYRICIPFIGFFATLVFVGAYLLEQECSRSIKHVTAAIIISTLCYAFHMRRLMQEYGIDEINAARSSLKVQLEIWPEILFIGTLDWDWVTYLAWGIVPVMTGISCLRKTSLRYSF